MLVYFQFSIMKEIADIIEGELRQGIPVEITEYSIDSRTVVSPEHTLFFALTGSNHNGHDYISTLYANGMRAFVINEYREEFTTLTEANFIHVENVLVALQQLARHHRQQIITPVIGITGSNGKTIVKEWIYQLMSASNSLKIYRSPRSYNSQVGVPLSLLGIEHDTDYSIIEAGISRKGEMSRLEKMIQPTIGIFTHLGDAHDENFTSKEEKLAEKPNYSVHVNGLSDKREKLLNTSGVTYLHLFPSYYGGKTKMPTYKQKPYTSPKGTATCKSTTKVTFLRWKFLFQILSHTKIV